MIPSCWFWGNPPKVFSISSTEGSIIPPKKSPTWLNNQDDGIPKTDFGVGFYRVNQTSKGCRFSLLRFVSLGIDIYIYMYILPSDGAFKMVTRSSIFLATCPESLIDPFTMWFRNGNGRVYRTLTYTIPRALLSRWFFPFFPWWDMMLVPWRILGLKNLGKKVFPPPQNLLPYSRWAESK